MTATAACYWCKFAGFGFPCRSGDSVDIGKLARRYHENVLRRANDPVGSKGQRENDWSFDCVDELINEAPQTAWAVILAMVARLDTLAEASLLAAGPLEDLIASRGSDVIGEIEAEARHSARFRLVLTGVWPQGREKTETWQRVLRARAPGPHLDAVGHLPAM